MNVVADAKAKLALWVVVWDGEDFNIKWENKKGLLYIIIGYSDRVHHVSSYLKKNIQQIITSNDLKEY